MTYCIADIHGCYDEFMLLLEKINFSEDDTLYVLGDVIDRGEKSVECIDFIRSRPNIICLMGNHEMLMVDYYMGVGSKSWIYNGGDKTLVQLTFQKDKEYVKETLKWIVRLPMFEIVSVNGKRFFLSHAGFDATKPVEEQTPNDYIWSRKNFIHLPALNDAHCIFGHTPTRKIDRNNDCVIWTDTVYKDKTCIDCACVFGGKLCALRLDDMEAFYVEAIDTDEES